MFNTVFYSAKIPVVAIFDSHHIHILHELVPGLEMWILHWASENGESASYNVSTIHVVYEFLSLRVPLEVCLASVESRVRIYVPLWWHWKPMIWFRPFGMHICVVLIRSLRISVCLRRPWVLCLGITSKAIEVSLS